MSDSFFEPTDRQITGLDDGHVQVLPCGQRLHRDAAEAFAALSEDARAAGFEMAVASGYRSFSRQLLIWNGKFSGQRVVHDDSGDPVAMAALQPAQQLAAVLRYSALPGTSRHHWGSDLDVYDAAALANDETPQLVPSEVAPGGPFDRLHCWLDERMKSGRSHGFFRPYALDRGGVAPERWHLSFAPLACVIERRMTASLLSGVLRQTPDLAMKERLLVLLPDLLARYVDVPGGWAESESGVGREDPTRRLV